MMVSTGSPCTWAGVGPITVFSPGIDVHDVFVTCFWGHFDMSKKCHFRCFGEGVKIDEKWCFWVFWGVLVKIQPNTLRVYRPK